MEIKQIDHGSKGGFVIEEGHRAPLRPFAKSVFDKTPEIRDVLNK